MEAYGRTRVRPYQAWRRTAARACAATEASKASKLVKQVLSFLTLLALLVPAVTAEAWRWPQAQCAASVFVLASKASKLSAPA